MRDSSNSASHRCGSCWNSSNLPLTDDDHAGTPVTLPLTDDDHAGTPVTLPLTDADHAGLQ
ncbi:hypothetical protein [Candidatus Epulonipiscium viviparus]|uniref:hypothetical protein n=1 Tax=Candidatus Epulonipiscium viviparus TaxID=420336 RepID=UPI0027381158|nr:hypothetical protein [Candidatus Epulopiscium viviparus]